MEIRVVGPLVVVRHGVAVALPPKERRVLARLALGAGETVSDDALRDAVWPLDAPATADKTLAGYVHRLRRVLGGEVIARRPTGYGLAAHHADVDVAILDEHVATARNAVASGDHDAAVSAYREAAALFRGRPFEELDDCHEAVVERARLRELRACIAEELHDLLLASGTTRELIPALEALVAREPTRERAWAQLMTAYARSGRQADALDAYSRARRTLAQELGIEPAPQLQALHRQLLDQDAALFTTADLDPSMRVSAHRPPLERLVGRDELLACVADELGHHRLVTLVGPGGAGKTRLAQRVAASEREAHLVDLAPVDGDAVVDALQRALGLQDHSPDPPVDVVARWCGTRPALVVLDNCEHVIDRVAELVAGMLDAAPGLRILATSRERLRVRGERVIDVDPLPTPASDADVETSPAVDLFLRRAVDAGVPIDLTNAEERAAVATVCRRLDGLPLALELGAAQLRTRSLIDLRDDLGTLDLPVTRRDLPARQRSLDALLAWSEALLDPPTVAALRRLAVFRGSFDATAAAAVMVGPPIAAGRERTALTALVEASLVVVERRPGSTLRYRLLETVRAHAEQRLVAAGERERTMSALGRWSEHVVAAIEPLIRTPRQDEAMAIAVAERLNIEPACDHAIASGDHRRALRLAATVPMGFPAERRALLLRLLADDADAPPALRARAWTTLANLASDVGDGTRQAAAAAEALAAANEADDAALAAWARYFLVLGRWAEGRTEGLGTQIAEAIAGFAAIGSAHGVASMHWIGSQVAEDPARAADLADLAVSQFRALDIPSGLAHALEGRALVALRADDRAAARTDLTEAVGIVSEVGNGGCTAHCVESVAAFAAAGARHDDAQRLAAAAAAVRRRSGHGMRVWEQEGHRLVVAVLGDAIGPFDATVVDLDVGSAAAMALAVLGDRQD